MVLLTVASSQVSDGTTRCILGAEPEDWWGTSRYADRVPGGAEFKFVTILATRIVSVFLSILYNLELFLSKCECEVLVQDCDIIFFKVLDSVR